MHPWMDGSMDGRMLKGMISKGSTLKGIFRNISKNVVLQVL